jgi:hypothetical protein
VNRRELLSAGPAVMVLVGAGVGVAVSSAAPPSSPVLDAACEIAALNRQHEAADVPHADSRELDRIWLQIWSQEKFILAATPTTVAEAMVILMVGAGQVYTAGDCEGAHAMADAGMLAVARATRYLAGTAGVSVADFGGDLYLPLLPRPACVGRAA